MAPRVPTARGPCAHLDVSQARPTAFMLPAQEQQPPQQQPQPQQQQAPAQTYLVPCGPPCWQPSGAPRPLRSSAGGRHQRSASMGLPSSVASTWWTGPLPPGTNASGGPASSGSLLHLGALGGALSTFVAESLGSRRPSFCLDSGTLARAASTRAPSRAGSSTGCLLPTCLICLDALVPEDWDSGEAITQACNCKGDVALRHRRCAVQWSLVKRSTVCDVCRAPITNLPELPPDLAPNSSSSSDDTGGGWEPLALAEPPGLSDYLIDAVRVMWCTLVVCILFGDMPVARAFMIGGVVGGILTAAAHALGMAQRSAAAVRAFAAALRRRAIVQGQQHQQQQHQPLAGDANYSWRGAQAFAVASAADSMPGPPLGTAPVVAGNSIVDGVRRGPAGGGPFPGHSRAPSSATVLLIPEGEPI